MKFYLQEFHSSIKNIILETVKGFIRRYSKIENCIDVVGCFETAITLSKNFNSKIEDKVNRYYKHAVAFCLTSDDNAGFTGIFLNENLFGYDREDGFWQPWLNIREPDETRTVKGLIDHELGHIMVDYVGYNFLESLYLKDFEEHKSMIRKNLSRYAITNLNEFFAEGWSEYNNSKHPRYPAQNIGENLEELYLLKTYGEEAK